ncbi:MAG: response regulator [Firmicutes bacterium]|nr:response regulator [Bacillota bacterium]
MTDKGKKNKVLLVDDDKQILSSLRVYLELENYQVETASNGQEAIEKVKRNKPEILVLDVMMPEMDGFEVLEQLKAEEQYADIPVVMLTAKSQDIDVLKGFRMGASSYMTKPFNLNELVENIELILHPDTMSVKE